MRNLPSVIAEEIVVQMRNWRDGRLVDGALTGLADRRLTRVLAERLTEEPTVVLNGPRTVGKSTLLASLAQRLGQTVIDCDDPATRAAVRNDPGRFAAGSGTVLIDEYRHVPEILDAIKAELNRDLRPGRYVLAGSTRYSTLPQARQSLTGRVDILDVLPLAQLEIDGVSEEPLVHRLLQGRKPSTAAAQSQTNSRRVRPPRYFGWHACRTAASTRPLTLALVRQLPRSRRGA